MKLFGIVVCALVINMTAGANTIQDLAKLINIPMRDLGHCIMEQPLTLDQMMQLERLVADKTAFNENPEKELKSFDCFIACVLEKSKIMRDDKISLENLLKTSNGNSPTDEEKKNMSECVEKANKEKGKCNIGHVFAVCLLQNMKVI